MSVTKLNSFEKSINTYNSIKFNSNKKNNFLTGLRKTVSTVFEKINSLFFEKEKIEIQDKEKSFYAIRCGGKNNLIPKPLISFKEVFTFKETVSLEDRLNEALTISEKILPNERNIMVLSNETNQDYSGVLRSFPTTGNGSCGFHSLFGRYNSNKKRFHLENYTQKRKEFSNWIKNNFENNDVPKYIKDSLREYISNPNSAPSSLQSALKKNDNKDLHRQFLENKVLDTPESRENAEFILIALIADKEIQKAYLKHIENNSSYLLPSELGAAAVWAGKSVNIYQNQEGEAFPPYKFNEGKDEVIEIVLIEESNHFERAVFNPL